MGIEEIRNAKKQAAERKPIFGLRKVSEKRRAKIKESQELSDKDDEFFAMLWSKRPHVCFETGEKLPNKWRKWNFHHVLPKGDYEEYRYEQWNVVLVTLAVHRNAEDNIDLCPKIKAYRDKLIKKLNL